jgi:DNA (cytosine-5)-methyltransferase 1
MVPQKTKQGYALAHVGDGIYTNRTHQKRGVVQKNMIPTLKTSPNDIGVVVDKDDLISIRRLTPRECWRLMGWNENRIDVALSTGVSDTQLYKMAGNSIVVTVLRRLFICI